MNIKRFHPRQVISVPATLGVRRAESFAVGEQGCVAVDWVEQDTILVVLEPSKGKRIELHFTQIGVVEADDTRSKQLNDFYSQASKAIQDGPVVVERMGRFETTVTEQDKRELEAAKSRAQAVSTTREVEIKKTRRDK